MHIDVALSPADIALLPQRDLSATTCVVFDVLRATSSMLTALANDAEEIHPAGTIEEALDLRAEMPEALLGGERHGDRIKGFDVGNSPFDYVAARGRTIITTTTNGTVALRAVGHAERVFIGAVLNIDALAEELRWLEPARVLLVCAGTFEEFALEDAFAAGLLVAALGEAERSDSALAALAVAKMYPKPIDALRASRNGRALAAKDRSNEVEWCARISALNVVGAMESSVIRPLPK
jgi:2-phosphosulfolactate phosphatase